MAGSDPRRAAHAETDPPDRPTPWRSLRARSGDSLRRGDLDDRHDVVDDERTRAAEVEAVAMPESDALRPDDVIPLRPRNRPRHAASRGTAKPAAAQAAPVDEGTLAPVAPAAESPQPRPEPPRPERPSRLLTSPRPAESGMPSTTAAGRAVVEALGYDVPAEAEPEPRVGPEPSSSTRVEPTSRRSGPTRSTPAEEVFLPRTMWRAGLGVALLAMLVATGTAGVAAYQERTTAAVGITAVLLVATLLVYGVRAASPAVRLTIKGGQLEYVRGAQREVFDLTSRYTRIEVVGTPGRRGWKVLFGRFGKSPMVIDAALVDPRRFTEVLDRHRHR